MGIRWPDGESSALCSRAPGKFELWRPNFVLLLGILGSPTNFGGTFLVVHFDLNCPLVFCPGSIGDCNSLEEFGGFCSGSLSSSSFPVGFYFLLHDQALVPHHLSSFCAFGVLCSDLCSVFSSSAGNCFSVYYYGRDFFSSRFFT